MARLITHAVFGGGPWFLEEFAQLKARLDWAVNMLGGLQQPDHSDSEAIARQAELNRARDNAALRDAARDILAGLGITPMDLIQFQGSDALYTVADRGTERYRHQLE